MARKLIVEIIGDSTSYQRALGKSEQSTRRFNETMKHSAKHVAKIGLEMAAVGAVIGVVASRQFNEFEDSMHKIVGLVGVSRDQVHAWSDDILKLSTEVAKSPKELADALFFVTSAGLRGADAMDTLRISAMASAAGLGETLTVADADTSAMNAYGKANLNAQQAADVLTATVREGKTAADALAPSIGVIAPLAAELGVGFNEVGAAIAGMTRSGTSAMKATTALRAVFATLLKPQKRSADAFKSVGLNIDTLRETLGEKGGLLKVLTLVKGAFAGNTTALAQAFPNVKALTSVLQLVGKNGAAVEKIFKNMTNTTGSVQHAFKAISEDEGFQFERTLQALRVAGIRLGAMLEPLANTIARTLTKAFQKVDSFLKDFGEAKTIRAKLNFVWTTATGGAKRLTDALVSLFNKIDWRAVMAGASGIAEGFTDALERVDWSSIGEQIGGAFKRAGDFIGPAMQNLAGTISKALHDIDWEAVGVAAGPGIITAMLSAFRALLDPGFWARNWQLALSVAIDALGLLFPEVFGLRKLGAIMLKPFAKLATPLARGISSSLSSVFTRVGSFLVDQAGRLSERLATALAADLIRLPGVLAGIFDRIFGRLFRRIAARFEKLNELTRFTIRLLGIAAVIRQIEGLVHKVGHLFSELSRVVANAWTRMWDWLEKKSIQAALKIIEPFTHIPKKLGGGTFQNLKKGWQETLLNMETDSKTSTTNIQANIDTLHGKDIVINVKTQRSAGPAVNQGMLDIARGEAGAGGGGGKPPPKPKNVETPEERKARLKALADKAETAFQNTIDSLGLKFDKAVAAKRFKAAEDILGLIKKTILARISVVGRTTELARMLWDNAQAMGDTVKDANQATADALKAAQFQALGLTAEGEKKLPGGKSLLKRATGMLSWIKGTALDTKQNRAQLNKIVSFLKKNFKTAGREVRQAIIDMLNDIKGAGDKTDIKGPLTKTKGLNTKKIVEGLGLDKNEAMAIRARLSGFNTAGRALAGQGTRSKAGQFVDDRPIVIHTTVNLDGVKVATNTTKHQQRSARRNPRQKRGPNKHHTA